MTPEPGTVVVRRRVRAGSEAACEAWLGRLTAMTYVVMPRLTRALARFVYSSAFPA